MENYIKVQKVEAEAATNHAFATWANGGELPNEYITKLVISGYKVVEDGGTARWISSSAFEASYIAAGEITFGEAIAIMQSGGKVTRTGWNNPDIFCEIQMPDANSKMTEPYIYMTKNSGATLFPIDLSIESILASDWTEVE